MERRSPLPAVAKTAGAPCKIEETIRFITQPECWAELFLDAKKRSGKGQRIDMGSRMSMLARTHFGDLQFLHAMASEKDELASVTHRRVIVWAEFAWRVGTGEYGLDTPLKEVPIEAFGAFFGDSGMNVQDLFTLGNNSLRPHIREVAFGSLLHVVQDSFARGHVDRAEPVDGATCEADLGARLAPGRIREFHIYVGQDGGKHAEYDSRDAFSAHWTLHKPDAIDVGQALLQQFGAGGTWDAVRPYLECVFAVEDPDSKASLGAAFQ